MSEMFTSEMEVEEGSLIGGGESPVHMMEPQVELDEDLDHHTLEPRVELEENIVEPQVEFQEGTDHNENNVYPFDPLAPEYFAETDGTIDSAAVAHEYSEAALNGLSQDSGDTNTTDVALNNNSLCNSVDTSLDGGMDTSNSMMDSNYKEDDNTDYNEMQRTYLKDFFSSSAFPTTTTTEESSDNSSVERIPLSRFPSIVKVVERAEYETIQILYQLLYQRSAWDTQELLSKRILEFSGFQFNKNSEEYYNRVMLLQTLPNSVLVKIGAILCLEQVKNVLSNVGLGRHDLINAIMEFLQLPKKKTRSSRFSSPSLNNRGGMSQSVEPCGCRNNCLSKFTEAERQVVATFHKKIKPKKKLELYFLSLITINKASKRPEEDAKKHRDYKYMYKIKIGKKEVSVCKGGFMMLHNVKMSMINHLQLVLKTEKYDVNGISKVEYPFIEGQEEPEVEPTNDAGSKENSQLSQTSDSSKSSNSTSETLKVDDELKKKLNAKVPAVVVEKIDPSKISSVKKKKQTYDEKKDVSKDDSLASKKDDNLRRKLKDFPLVVKSLDEVAETLLIDLHFLLFSSSADSDKLKGNILDFDGFKFAADSEEYDERNDFLQRMSGKLLTDVARAFSLGLSSKREETIQNILSFLMKPDESCLRTSVNVPVILSDVELDDMEGFSDSDESITCEVVEKKVECIDLLSSGEDSDIEGPKIKKIKKEKVDKSEKLDPSFKITPAAAPTPAPVSATSSIITTTTTPTSTNSTASAAAASNTASSSTSPQSENSGGIRKLRDFETIRKIVNTHPPEYLVDIYELLFLKKNEVNADTLRNEILDFTGFTFEKGSQDYVKRKQVLDRMLYNNVRRVYNTLIHNSTEVKVFSKPTMINEIFQFLFKLPDHDTSVRPLPPGAKTLMPKTPGTATTVKKANPIVTAPPTSAPASILPSQSGKLSDLKRVFQRVACFPCEYLTDVHKLLFMTDCDPKVIRQNIFGFKGFSFGVDSSEFQQRKMYLEYLTFHSLRKISSVLTTRSVDLRNSTKHELASHLTDVLAEYCNTCIDTDAITPASAKENATTSTTSASTTAATTPKVASTTASEKIVVTPSIPTIQAVMSVTPTTTTTAASKNSKSTKSKSNPLNISIVETHSITSPAVTTSSPSTRGSRKRKSQTVRQMVSEKKAPPQPTQPSDFADIHLPEVEQYRQIYGANLNVYPSVPTIAGITSYPQTFPQLVPQTMTFVSPYPQALQMAGVQQTAQMIGLQSTPITMTSPIITQVSSKPPEIIVPADIEQTNPDSQKPKIEISGEKSSTPAKESPSKDSDEDGDQPLASLVGHPTDAVLQKQIADIVDKTDLQDITMNGVIQRIYDMYPKFDLSYRKEFIKSSLRTILYKLGDEDSKSKDNARDSNSPDCSVSTSDIQDNSAPESPKASV